jgi:hypothetical protein
LELEKSPKPAKKDTAKIDPLYNTSLTSPLQAVDTMNLTGGSVRRDKRLSAKYWRFFNETNKTDLGCVISHSIYDVFG